jgi:hypothetical protein
MSVYHIDPGQEVVHERKEIIPERKKGDSEFDYVKSDYVKVFRQAVCMRSRLYRGLLCQLDWCILDEGNPAPKALDVKEELKGYPEAVKRAAKVFLDWHFPVTENCLLGMRNESHRMRLRKFESHWDETVEGSSEPPKRREMLIRVQLDWGDGWIKTF